MVRDLGAPPERLVVDSSVAVKWFVDDEHGVVDAWRLLERHRGGDTRLAAPAHLPLEVLNALRWRGLDGPSLVDAAKSIEHFDLDVFTLETTMLGTACLTAVEHGLTVYDAMFLALADSLDAPLVTADRRLVEAAGERGRLLG